MAGWILKLFGMKLAKRALHGHKGRAPLFDIGLGFTLLRDRRVPIVNKLTALGLGGILIAVLMAMEAPVEALVAMLLNVPGLGLDLMVDGLELLAGPVLVAAILLPRLVHAAIVQRVQAEGAGLSPAPVMPGPRGYSAPNHLS